MSVTVLVTGGLGYLGGRLCQALRARDATALRLTTTRDPARLPAWADGLDVRRLDLASARPDTLAEALDGVDGVVHLAALNARQCAADPLAAVAVNVGGTQAMLTAAAGAAVKRVLYVSTAHVYGAPLAGRIDEDMVPRPRHPYAWSHRAAEDIVLGTAGVGGVVLRLSNGFGAPVDAGADCWSLAGPDLCRQAMTTGEIVLRGDGTDVRDFIALGEVVRAIQFFLFDAATAGSDLYNLGSAKSRRILDVARDVAGRAEALTGRPVAVKPGPASAQAPAVLDYRVDRIAAAGFRPDAGLGAEIDATLRFCREHAR